MRRRIEPRTPTVRLEALADDALLTRLKQCAETYQKVENAGVREAAITHARQVVLREEVWRRWGGSPEAAARLADTARKLTDAAEEARNAQVAEVSKTFVDAMLELRDVAARRPRGGGRSLEDFRRDVDRAFPPFRFPLPTSLNLEEQDRVTGAVNLIMESSVLDRLQGELLDRAQSVKTVGRYKAANRAAAARVLREVRKTNPDLDAKTAYLIAAGHDADDPPKNEKQFRSKATEWRRLLSNEPTRRSSLRKTRASARKT